MLLRASGSCQFLALLYDVQLYLFAFRVAAIEFVEIIEKSLW